MNTLHTVGSVGITVTLIALTGCGDSSGTGGAGGAGTATTTSSTTSSTSKTSSTTGTTTSATVTSGATTSVTSTSTGTQDCGALSTKTDCRNCCGTEFTAGTKKLIDDIANSCGCQANAACSTQCAGEAFCTDMTSQLGTTCNTCIGALQGNEACATAGLATCHQDAACDPAETCQLSCQTLP